MIEFEWRTESRKPESGTEIFDVGKKEILKMDLSAKAARRGEEAEEEEGVAAAKVVMAREGKGW